MTLADLLPLLPLLLAIGGAGGFLSGLLGVGGGIVYTPALLFVLDRLDLGGPHAAHLAVGTSLAAVAFTVLVSARAHHARGAVDGGILRRWGPFVILGVVVGALLAGRADGAVLRCVFSVITMLMAVYMLLGRDAPEGGKGHPALTPGTQQGIAAAIGTACALTGMGGGAMSVPVMKAAGIQIRRAVGTATALGFLTSLPGAATYAVSGWTQRAEFPPFSLGFVNAAAVLPLALGAMIAAPFGARLAHGMDRTKLRRLAGAVYALLSLKMLVSLL